MSKIYSEGSNCSCGGKFEAMPENKNYDPPVPEGAYVKCNKCDKMACVPSRYQPWKKKYDKKQEKKKEK